MSTSEDARVWREHEQWLDCRARLAVVRERWTEDDWAAARLEADAAWDPGDLYLYAAEWALREQHYRRTKARLAVECRLGVAWLLDVLERTAAR